MTLYSRDTKGKVRFVEFVMELVDNHYVIKRLSGLLGGKSTEQPSIEIFEGKAKRTVKEQAELQFNALVKKAKDKGYVDETTLPGYGQEGFDVDAALPQEKVDQNGSKKPQLCKVIDFQDVKLLGKTFYASFKLDGTRSFMYFKDGKVQTASRGGQDYNVAASYICDNQVVMDFFKSHPDVILDGEIYRHGWNLQKISGLCRLDNVTEDHKELRFHCYDVVEEDKTFEERLADLRAFSACLSDSPVIIVEHTKIGPYNDLKAFKEAIMTYHDNTIAQGYEGAVIRDASEKYKCGARDRRMQKIKIMDTTTFKIVGYELGLRGVEDMCFVLETKAGKRFKAKPEGDLQVKEDYMRNMDNIIGRGGDVRFFHYTPDGIPNLPVFCVVRYDLNEY